MRNNGTANDGPATNRWLVPGCGIGAVALITASLAAGGNSPLPDAPVDKLVAFYSSHTGAQTASGALLSLGALVFLVFVSGLMRLVRAGDRDRAGLAAKLSLSGGTITVVGMTGLAGLAVTLGDVVPGLSPPALQALQAVSLVVVFTLTVGMSAFLLGAGFAFLRTGAMPRWVAWLAVVIGAVAAVPGHVLGGALDHVGFAAFMGMGVWTVIASVWLWRGSRGSAMTSDGSERPAVASVAP